MRIATWNVNGLRARGGRLVEFLAERAPDIACLQELKIRSEEIDTAPFTALGYHVAAVGQAGWNGVAVVARTPVESRLTELPGAAEAGARFLSVFTGGLEVMSVYVPNGKTEAHADFTVKLAFLDSLATHVEGRSSESVPLVVGGDFNVCTTDLDSYLGASARGTIFHTDRERALMQRLASAGLVDLYREKHPEEAGYSWWDYRAGAFHKKLGMRLDLLLASRSLASCTEEVIVERDFRKKSKTSGAIPSDHAPVVATIARVS